MKRSNRPRFILAVLILTGTIAASKVAERRTSDMLLQPLETIPMELNGWSALEIPVLPRVADKLNATTLISRNYQKNGREMALFIAYYAQQRAGESMHSPKNCLPGSGWTFLSQETTPIQAGSKLVQVNQASIQNGADKRLILYWYQSRRRIVASEVMGKLLTMQDAILDGRTAGSLVRVMLPQTPGSEEEMRAFAVRLIPEIQRCLGH
jgi:EpsI family protein